MKIQILHYNKNMYHNQPLNHTYGLVFKPIIIIITGMIGINNYNLLTKCNTKFFD